MATKVISLTFPGISEPTRDRPCSEFCVAMIGYHNASSALIILVLLKGFLHLSTPNPIDTPGDVADPQRATPTGMVVSGDGERRNEERRSREEEEEGEREDELFKDVDPKTLAAVLLEALNRSQVERKTEGEDVMEDGMKAYSGEVRKEEAYREVGTMEGADRDRDGRQKIELLMAAQGREQQRQEAEERKKAQEEEEKMTERVTSHTTSQTVKVQTQQQHPSPDGRGVEGQDAASQQGPTSPEQSEEVEEQLNPEELKSLETMMKEFPRLNTDTKRDEDLEQNQRASRGYSTYNDILPMSKGSNPAMSKKKLKWQEETQKGMNFPTFKGGNFMDEFEDGNYAGRNAAQSQPLQSEQEAMENDEPEEEEAEEEEENQEVLSPEEEEAQAKAEQEEMRRQAAEAQKAKMEEEKLADIASDMLLRYMVKQNNGNKKYSSSLSNAAEDKRSDEEQEVVEDDIDPQTIDKLIEISSKLHLPADDVVDIISDVEKKKKKDLPPETSHWQRPLRPLSGAPSTNGLSVPQTNQNSFPVSKQSSPAVNLLKTWFQEQSPPRSQDLWRNPAEPLLANQNIWAKPQKSLLMKQEPWLKSPKSVWTGYLPYPNKYPSYYQRKLYPDYYPIYYPPPPRPKLRYYVPKPALTLSNYLQNSGDVAYNFPPKPRYQNWVQPRLRKPPAGLRQKTYYTSYPVPMYPQRIQPLPSHPRLPVIPPQQKQFSALVPAVPRNKDYYFAGTQPDSSKTQLEKYIQQILMKRPQMLD